MKKLLIGLLAAGLLTGTLPGCNSKLDVKPTNSIDVAEAFNTSSDVEAALVGAYTGLQDANAYGGYIQFFAEVLPNTPTTEYQFTGTFIEPQEIQRKNILKDNITVANIWLRGYSTINRVNNVLANTGKLDTPAKQASGEGEARFIRALVYFDLVRLYARAWNDGTPGTNPGVPLVLVPTLGISASNSVPRNSVAEVYARVIDDLTIAEAKLPPTNGFFANKNAAAALLARVYLQQGRFADAAAAANRVVSTVSNSFRLATTYAENFVSSTASGLVPNSAEDIFAIQFSAQSGVNQLNTFYTRRNDIKVKNPFLSQYEAGDDRRLLYTSLSNTGTASVLTTKFAAQYGNVKLFRLAEMYLVRAEGNLRAGTSTGATPLADVNRIRGRANLAPLAAVALADILKERRLELAFEGFRLHDFKRNQESTTDPVTGAAIAWNSPRLVFPIPLREINANPNLTQNEGYQ